MSVCTSAGSESRSYKIRIANICGIYDNSRLGLNQISCVSRLSSGLRNVCGAQLLLVAAVPRLRRAAQLAAPAREPPAAGALPVPAAGLPDPQPAAHPPHPDLLGVSTASVTARPESRKMPLLTVELRDI